MKKQKNKITYIIALISIMLVFTSCLKERDYKKNLSEQCSGVPIISGISRTTATLTTIDTLTQANLGDYVIIHGANLCSAKQIMFDDLDVTLANAYITSDAITVQIPRKIPTTISSKVKVISDAGSADRSFKLTFPPLVVTGMLNESTAEGDIMTILGDNFDLYEVTPGKGKVKFGNVEADVISNTSNTLTVKVPVGAPVSSIVTVVGVASKASPFLYKDNTGIIYDCDNGIYGDAGSAFITDGTHAGDPAPINGRYLRFTVPNYNSWWSEIVKINIQPTVTNWAGHIPADAFANPQDYLLKFEFNSNSSSFTNAFLGVWYGNNLDTKGLLIDTQSKWITLSEPFTQFFPTAVDPSKGSYFSLIGRGGGPDPMVDWCFDNIRVVHK